MTTHVSLWTTARVSERHDADTGHLPRYGAQMQALAPPVGVWPLLGTVAATKLAMLTAIVWASSTLAAGTLLAALDIPLVVTLLAFLSWALLVSSHAQHARSAAEEAR